MSDQPLIDSVSASQASASLDKLATLIRTEHEAVGIAARNMLEHALRAGDALHAAKKQVSEGGWELWMRKHCGLSLRCAQVYMQLASARSLIEAQAQHAAPHSLRAALKLIGPPSETSSRSHNTTSKTKPATYFDALGWWTTASLEQRRHLLDGIGHTPILEALPPAWRDEFEQRVANHLTAEQLLELLERKIEHTPKTRAALKDIRKALRRPQLDLVANAAAGKPTQAVTKSKDGSHGNFVDDDVFHGYRKLPLGALEDRILQSARGWLRLAFDRPPVEQTRSHA